MTQSQTASERNFEHSLTAYLRAKKNRTLLPSDVEPQAQDFGISEWHANLVKHRVQKELDQAG
jgi:hypothetical protein